MQVMEKAPAKINLCLNVLGKREDGFHEMEMVMTTIDLSDRLTFTLQEKDVTVDSNSSFMPLDERNIVVKTAQLVKDTYRVDAGVHIYIDKQIPIAAGLGGGSSDAAATLRALNDLWELNRPLAELAELGEQIGSDIPFCVYGQTAYVTGRGEMVTPLPSFPSCWIIVVKPFKGISSWTVFKDLNVKTLPHYPVDSLLQGIKEGAFDACISHVGNALEEKASEQNPHILTVKKKMLAFGADAALMSGTGPTVFGLTQNLTKAKRIVNGLSGFCKEVYLVRHLN